MRVLALDHGAARCGCAVSDPSGTLATPLRGGRAAGYPQGAGPRSRALAAELEAERVVVGLPLTLAGEEGAQAATRARVRRAPRARLDVPVELYDERLTTRHGRARPAGAPTPTRAPPRTCSRATWPRGVAARLARVSRRPLARGARAARACEREARAAPQRDGGARLAREAAATRSAAEPAVPAARRAAPVAARAAASRRPPRRQGRVELRAAGARLPERRARSAPRRPADARPPGAAAARGRDWWRSPSRWFLLSLFQPFKGDGDGHGPGDDPARARAGRDRRRARGARAWSRARSSSSCAPGSSGSAATSSPAPTRCGRT